MIDLRRKVLLPIFRLTEVTHAADPLGLPRDIPKGKGREPLIYYCRPLVEAHGESRFNYNLFPMVLDRAGRPWLLATNFLLDKMHGESKPNMVTYRSLADDLGAFREWLDQTPNPEEMLFQFPQMKQQRCTYRYNGFLKSQISSQEVIKPTTARRRMSTVVAFYRWLIREELFEPEHAPWIDRSSTLSFKGSYGAVLSKKVVSTDVGIKVAKAADPVDDTILDGGKLRPLPKQEQQWVMEGLNALGNPEMYLIFLFMLATGARIQTATTLRVQHFTGERPVFFQALSGGGSVYKLRCGPGTGIDTKSDKQGVLQIPEPLYRALRTYALSARAQRRRLFSGDDPVDQYLFLTQQGNPYYMAKAEAMEFDPDFTSRHSAGGATIRKFLTNQLIPYVRKHHAPNFTMRSHDLRATFGMNQTDIQMELVDAGNTSLSKARDIVRQLMWHQNAATTDLYLDYRRRLEQVYAAINGYGEQVQRWIDQAMTGVLND